MKVRKASSADVEGIAKVHVDSWRTTYRGIVSDQYLANLSYEERAKMWKQITSSVLVTENDEGEIIGFVSYGKERSGNYPGYAGEIYAIYLIDSAQGKGIGKTLMCAAADELRKDNIHNMLVFVLAANPANKFYEKLGGSIIGNEMIEIGGEKLEEYIIGWKDIDELTCS